MTNRRKVGMTSSHHGPYVQGYTRATMGGTEGLPTREGELIPQNRAQFGSGSATRPCEAGIASNGASARRREYVPGPCTHRPSHHERGLHLKSLDQPARDDGRRRCGS